MAQDISKLPGFFDGVPTKEHTNRWDKCWQDEFTPWDRGGPSMALYDLLKANPDGALPLPGPNARKKALVPGCGRGHDVLLLSSFGYNVYGLDASDKALVAAQENAAKALDEGRFAVEGGGNRGTVTWIKQDFFAENWRKDVEPQFDLIYDYTFFCALPPPMRSAWASKMKSLLAPAGRLVCLEFPAEKTASEPGPPWAAPPSDYLAYLANPGAQPQTDEHGGVLPELVELPVPGGIKRLVHVKPSRTHKSGTQDGRVQDFVSVWAHADE
ncbi:S-adenosyl-L-methionine-dependent methyltransferase [Xylaria nigripes]|nr:S-adenosyl-L-methionine-dependent methyltransferase [Xylaria nigripes]